MALYRVVRIIPDWPPGRPAGLATGHGTSRPAIGQGASLATGHDGQPPGRPAGPPDTGPAAGPGKPSGADPAVRPSTAAHNAI